MPADELTNVNTLTFDIFGTVLDLSGSIIPPLADFLVERNASIDGETLWLEWRARQRIEQHQDTILMLGHRGYLDSARRALVYCLRNHRVEFNQAAVESFMRVFENLAALRRRGGGPEVSWRAIPARGAIERGYLAARTPDRYPHPGAVRPHDLGGSRGAVQAAPVGVPRSAADSRGRARGGDDGRRTLVRHSGCTGLWVSRGLRESVRAAVRDVGFAAGLGRHGFLGVGGSPARQGTIVKARYDATTITNTGSLPDREPPHFISARESASRTRSRF